jgi:gamma-glutamylcyclotransferase (GGCT)/AIG2-like uncharacterized protein YtfP
MSHHLVFVYGTLLQGECNSHWLNDARLYGPHHTQPLYSMLNLGEYPGVIEQGASSIIGEVYQINAQQLAQLDRLEEYPTLYCREPITTPYGDAWIYLYRGGQKHQQMIYGGDWKRR